MRRMRRKRRREHPPSPSYPGAALLCVKVAAVNHHAASLLHCRLGCSEALGPRAERVLRNAVEVRQEEGGKGALAAAGGADENEHELIRGGGGGGAGSGGAGIHGRSNAKR